MFKKLLNKPTSDEIGDYRVFPDKQHLNEPTKNEEIPFTIKMIKNGKVQEKITVEFFKFGENTITKQMDQLINMVWKKEKVSEAILKK